jgi:hypothetical protein
MTTRYDSLFDEAGKTYNVDPALLRAMARVESNYNPDAVNPHSGAAGLMQIMPATAKSLGVADPFDPKQAIHGAAKLMRENLDRFGNPEEAVLAYHGGTDKRNWGPKTHGYLERVANFFVKPAGAADKPPSQEQWSTGFLKSIEDAPAPAQPQPQPQRATPASASASVPDTPWSTGFLKQIGATAPQEAADATQAGNAWSEGFLRGIAAVEAAPAPAAPSTLENVAAGIVRGGRDVIDPAYGWLAEHYGTPERQRQAKETVRRDLAEYEAGAGQTLAGGAGRVGGQLLTTGPMLSLVEAKLAAPLAGMVARGGSAAARALEGVGDNLLTRAFAQVARAGARGVEGLGRLGVTAFRGGPGIGARALHGAEQGALGNLLTAGTSDAPLGQQALTGAELGAVLGAGVPLVGHALSPLAANLAEYAGLRSAQGNALMDLRRGLGGTRPQDVAEMLRGMGPEARLADAPVETIQRLGDAVATGGGPGANVAREALETRQAGALDRVGAAVAEAFGITQPKARTIEGLLAKRAEDSRPLYREAWAHELAPTPEQAKRLGEFMADPDFQKAAKAGGDILRLEALKGGNSANSKVELMRMLDYVKRGLDDQIEKFRDPVTRKFPNNAKLSALKDARAAYVELLDQINPKYAAARAAWAGPSEARDLIEMGGKLASKNPDIADAALARLSKEQRELVATGFGHALMTKLETGGPDADFAKRIFRDKASRRRIEAMIGDPERFAKFEDAMKGEMAMHETLARTLRGSPTARRLSAMSEGIDPGVLVDAGNALGHGLAGNTGSALGFAASLGRRLMGAPTAARNEHLAELLYGTEGLNALQQLARPANRVGVVMDRYANALMNPALLGTLAVSQ